MPLTRLVRIVAGATIAVLGAVILTGPTASAAEITRVVSGHVFLGDADHTAGVGEVTVRAGEFSAQTDASGAYAVAITSGLAEGDFTLLYDYHGAQLYGGAVKTVRLATGDVSDVDVTLELTPTIEGRVVDSSGAPLAGVAATILGYRDGVFQYSNARSTDADGRYRFGPLDPDLGYRLAFQLSGHAYQTWPDTGAFYPPGEITLGAHEVRSGVDVTLYRSASVSCAVTAPSISGASLAAAGPTVSVLVRDRGTGAWVEAQTSNAIDERGNCALNNLAPDSYRFRVLYTGPYGNATVTGPVVTLGEGAHATVSARLHPFKHDFTDDDDPDLLVRNSAGKLIIYPTNGRGGFLKSRVIGSGWQGMTAIVSVGDFVGDTLSDVIARDRAGAYLLYEQTSAGHWYVPEPISIGKGLNLLLGPGDFDGDGHVDLLARDAAGHLVLYRGNGNHGWRGKPAIVGTGWGSYTAIVAAGDMNEDGSNDIVARDAAGSLWLYPGNGTAGWKSRVLLGTGWRGYTAIVGVGDVTGDGAPDIYARDGAGKLWLFPGNGAGALSPRRLAGTGWSSLRFAG